MRAICGCGAQNYDYSDWVAHFRYGKSFWHSLKLLLMTRIYF